MTKCKPYRCEVGVMLDSSDNYLLIWEADLMREGSNVLEDIARFMHCPECGQKINWKRIEKEIKDYFKKLVL